MGDKTHVARTAKEGNRLADRRSHCTLVVAAVVATSLAQVFGQGLPELAETGEIQTEDGKKGFSLTAKLEGGMRTRGEATPRRLVYTVTGGIKAGPRAIPLLRVPPEGDQLTEREKEYKKAAERLLAASGAFVAPRHVKVTPGSIKGKIHVKFMFLGEENPNRRIRVTLKLKWLLGGWHTQSRDCEDQRIIAKQPVTQFRSRRPMRSKVNNVIFVCGRVFVRSLRALEVSFEEFEVTAAQ